MNRRPLSLLAIALAIYALTGFYVVGGNEKGAVRRFGKFIAPLKTSGLHYDWPYPFRQLDRINFAAVRTLNVGASAASPEDRPLGEDGSPRAFLTGDQNLLHVRAQVLYRPSEAHIEEFLFAQSAPEPRLQALGEAVLVDLLARSGVDFAHVRGLAELNDRLTSRLRTAAAEQQLGIEIEQAVLEQVDPPLRVKAEFLDVSNARAEQARTLQEARTWEEQKLAHTQAECQRITNNALAESRTQIAVAEGSADRFRRLVSQMQAEAERTGGDYDQVRQLTVQRLSWRTLAEIWPKVRKKSIVDAGGPVDLSVWPNE
jgi:membrane protease subunit HflK